MEYIQDKSAFNSYLYHNCHCINAFQTSKDRRLKYAIARSFGKDRTWAMALRDWRNTQFAKFFGYSSYENLIKSIEENLNNA